MVPSGSVECSVSLEDTENALAFQRQQQQQERRDNEQQPLHSSWLPPIQKSSDATDVAVTRRVLSSTSTMANKFMVGDCCQQQQRQQEEDYAAEKGRRRRRRRFQSSGFRTMTSIRLANVVVWLFLLILFYQKRTLFGEPGMMTTISGVEEEGFPNTEKVTPHMDVGPRLNQEDATTKVMQNVEEETVQREQPGIIHIVHTRYMQHQAHLVDLGLARLELLKEFPLASLRQQTEQNFVWVIRTDPNLNETLKTSLIDALEEESSNTNDDDDDFKYILVASNDNPNIQTESLLEEIDFKEPNSIWSGNHETFTNYLSRVKSSGSVVLESRLDADDALHKDFVKTIQESAMSLFSTTATITQDNNNNNEEVSSSSTSPFWKVWCASSHTEWQYRGMWETDSPEIGALHSIKDAECISSGLTIGYCATSRQDFHQSTSLPRMKHDQLAHHVPSCKQKKHHDKNNGMECLDFVHLIPTALRARTPTSAGMLNILLNTKDGTTNKKYEKAGAGNQADLQPRLWQHVERVFGFSEESARRVHAHLEPNMRAIATDNLKGQCTEGHSCKESSKVMLQMMIDHPEYI